MIQGTVVGTEAVVTRFQTIPSKLRNELRVGVNRAGLIVQTETKQNKLSGQVLNVRTGRLRRSINVKETETDQEITSSVGTNVEYAAAHEYGFKGVVTVRDHMRMSKLGSRFLVRAHSRKVDLPERSFLRSALRDKRTEVLGELEHAVERSLQ